MKRLKPSDDRPIFMDEAETPSAAADSGVTPGYIKAPEPGVYPNVDFDTYLKWDAENHSTVRHIERSPASYLRQKLYPNSKETESKAFGTAEHCLLFEPDQFERRLLAPPINPTTKRPYKDRDGDAFKKFIAENPGRIIMGDEELERLHGSIRAIKSHADAWAVLSDEGQREVAIVWDEQTEYGVVRCKARIDFLPKNTVRLDLKSCEDASAPVWVRAMLKHGYHTADRWYDRGCKALGLKTGRQLFLCVESSPNIVDANRKPAHAAVIYQVEEETSKVARDQVDGWIHKLARCRKFNEWPAYPTGVQIAKAPRWFFSQWADDE